MPRLSLTRSQLETPVALDLLQLLHSVTANGRLTQVEIGELAEWLRQHAESQLPAVAYLRDVVMRVLEDGVITPEEQAWVQKAVETVLPAADREEAAVRRREAAAKARRQASEARETQHHEQRLARPLKHFDVMAMGVYNEDRQAVISGIEEGEPITLAREPGNPFSPNAVLFQRHNGRGIGYLPEGEAVQIAPLLDAGARHDAEVKKILDGTRGLIPVVWGEIYAAESHEGSPSPRIAYVESPSPRAESPRSTHATPPPTFPRPVVPRKTSREVYLAVGLIGFFLIAMVILALVLK